ncbi:tetratricopeptide repeat protein [Oceanithermus sp.]
MASGYVYRQELLRRAREHLRQGPVVFWGPPGMGKTLLLKELARSLGLDYRTEWSRERAAYDLSGEPAEMLPGQALALAERPRRAPAETLLLGPDELEFSRQEVAELARRLRRPACAEPAWENLGGWPLLVRRALESGVCRGGQEPLRGYLEVVLGGLGDEELALLHLLTEPLPEAAWREAGWGEVVDCLLRGGWVQARSGRLLPRRAVVGRYLRETRGKPPLEALEPVLRFSLDIDPEAAFLVYRGYDAPAAARVFPLMAERLLARGEYDKVVSYWEELPPKQRTAAAALRVAEAERSRGRLREALALAEWAARQGGETEGRALNVKGTVLIHMGRYREAATALERSLERADEASRYRIMAGLGAALIRMGEFSRAVEVLEEATSLAEAASDVEMLAKMQHNLGIALHHSGRLRAALIRYREALELKAGAPPLTRSNTLLSLGEALRLLGCWQEAHEALVQALELARASGEYRAIGYAALNLGDLYLEADWLEEAEESYRLAESVLKPVEDRYGLGLMWLGQAALARKRGAVATARDALEKAERELAEGGSSLELAQVWLERARLEPGRAAYWLARAEEAAAEAGGEYHRLLARVRRVALGDLPAAKAQEVAEWVLREDAYAVALNPELVPAWLAAAADGGPARVLLEKLAFGYGCWRVYSFAGIRIFKDEEVSFPTAKEGWLLMWLWLRPNEDPMGLFEDVKRPKKRLQLAVHHLRSRLGEEWVRLRGSGYRSTPLPGVWWDAAVFEAAAAAPGFAEMRRELLGRLYRGPFVPGGPFDRERERFDWRFRELAGD